MDIIEKGFKFFKRTYSEQFHRTLATSAAKSFERKKSIYEASVTIWLMIYQRLNNNHSLDAAVKYLKKGGASELYETEVQKVRGERASVTTGGYSRARKRVSLEVIKEVSDNLNHSLIASHRKQGYKGRKIFLVDGSTLRISHTEDNLSSYKQHNNQHGKVHYPQVLFTVMIDAVTGVSLRPEFGSYAGEEASSELKQYEELLPRLPEKSIIIGDRNYGSPRTVEQASEYEHDVIFRIKESKAKKLFGNKLPKANGEKDVTWDSNSSRTDREEYSVEGRVISFVTKRKGFKDKKLYLFTTLDLPIKEIAELYALRWNVELDLRQLKTTLGMNMLNSKSPDMIAKEIITGFIAYNLVRHIAVVYSKIMDVEPREIKFTSLLNTIISVYEMVYSSDLSEESLRHIDYFIMDTTRGLKKPKRNYNKKNEPRKSWRKGKKSYITTSREEERKLVN